MPRPRPRSYQGGYLLIENLVTIAILAVGLLGLSALQLTALKSGQGAIDRGEMALLMSGMTERMRANTSAVLAGDYELALTANPPLTTIDAISAKQVASNDQAEWINEIIVSLGVGNKPKGEIICHVRVCTLNVLWGNQHGKTPTELAFKNEETTQNYTITALF